MILNIIYGLKVFSIIINLISKGYNCVSEKINKLRQDEFNV